MADCFITRRGDTGSGGAKTDFDLTGIIGYFDTSTVDLDNNKWINKIDDTYNVNLPYGGTIQNDALFLSSNQYGKLSKKPSTGFEPYTFYCVFKAINTITNFAPIITKGMSTSSAIGKNFSIHLATNGNIIGSSCGDDVISNIQGYDYHVVCVTKYNNLLYLYIDGACIGSTNILDGYGSDNYYINYLYRNGSADTPTNTEYKMCAIGVEYHPEDVILKNSEYLMKKYNVPKIVL